MKSRATLLFGALGALLLLILLLAARRAFLSSDLYSGMDKAFWIAAPFFLGVLFFALAAVSRKSSSLYSCIILGSLCLFFAAAETYFRLEKVGETNVSSQSMHLRSGAANIPEDLLYTSDPLLGASLKKGPWKAAHRRVYGPQEKPAYDVIYSVNEQGRRITPEWGKKAESAVLLFGCSYTFGMGVNDKDTYAWKLAEGLGEKYQVINLGVSGYGAHQMLALLQSGRLDAVFTRYKHIYAFFLTIADHPRRCTGIVPWSKRGPRYMLEGERVVYAGDLAETNRILRVMDNVFRYSALYHVLRASPKLFNARQALALHTALIAEAAKRLAKRNIPLTVIVWPDFPEIVEKLQARSLSVLMLAPAMPDWNSSGKRGPYTIAHDGHPTSLGHTIVARELLRHLTKKTPGTSPPLQ